MTHWLIITSLPARPEILDKSKQNTPMTRYELWLKKYQEVKAFIETNHRNPSRHNPEERFKYYNWLKHNKKLLNAGEMKEDRVELFEGLLEAGEMYRRVNQYA